jgi:hypothetical protein
MNKYTARDTFFIVHGVGIDAPGPRAPRGPKPRNFVVQPLRNFVVQPWFGLAVSYLRELPAKRELGLSRFAEAASQNYATVSVILA